MSKEVEALEPSEALEWLDKLSSFDVVVGKTKKYDISTTVGNYFRREITTIKQALLKAQEQEKENAYIEKIKTMMKQKDCVLRYIENEDCFAVKTILSDGWYKLTPAFVDDNVREEIKPLPIIEKIKQLKEENAELRQKAQEPKHYLKWEDLEFTRNEKVMLVKMGDTVYKILYRCCDGIEEVQLLSEDEKLLILNLIGKYKDNIQVFNDLRLERVEE